VETETGIEGALADLFTAHGWTLAVAEASTGGLLGHRLTDRPGASTYFLGGIIPYSNASKIALLGVPADLLARVGAVSPEVAVALARGVRERFGATVGLAITGLLGPATGRRSPKPPGLTYIALATAQTTLVIERRFSGDRQTVKALSVQTALEWCYAQLAGGLPTPSPPSG